MRNMIIRRMKDELMKHKEILSLFEAGSASFNRIDEFSDIDLGVVVKDDYEEKAVDLLENIMNSIAPVEKQYILPQPTWHGHFQGFYHLKETNPHLILDILVMKESSKSYMTEIEEHGIPIILFDNTGRLGNEHIDFAQLDTSIARRIDSIKFICSMLYKIVEKEICRSKLIDAIDYYNNMFLRSYVTLLRIKYDPTRFSFGNRYLSYVLPKDEYNELLPLFFVKDVEDLDMKQTLVLGKMEKLLAEF
jgi:hypothetical protein